MMTINKTTMMGWVSDALNKVNRLDLLPLVKLEWNTRYTRCMGTYSPKNGEIELSTQLFARATLEQQKQTVIHELCHMIVDYITRRAGKPAVPPHGALWKRQMVLVGHEAKRCHNVDRTGLRRTVTRYKITCGCPTRSYQVTKTMLTRIQNKYGKPMCKHCNTYWKTQEII